GAARIHVRPGARRRRRRRAPPLARPRGQDSAPLARARGGRVLRSVLLRLGHTLLSGKGPFGTRRPDADGARAGALLLLARVGAPADPAETDCPRRRPGGATAAQPETRERVRRASLR